jgi:hypothetical protein
MLRVQRRAGGPQTGAAVPGAGSAAAERARVVRGARAKPTLTPRAGGHAGVHRELCAGRGARAGAAGAGDHAAAPARCGPHQHAAHLPSACRRRRGRTLPALLTARGSRRTAMVHSTCKKYPWRACGGAAPAAQPCGRLLPEARPQRRARGLGQPGDALGGQPGDRGRVG